MATLHHTTDAALQNFKNLFLAGAAAVAVGLALIHLVEPP